VTYGPRKKALDFGGNPDHVTLRIRLKYQVGPERYCAWEDIFLLDSNRSSTSAALAEVCAVVSAILVFNVSFTIENRKQRNFCCLQMCR